MKTCKPFLILAVGCALAATGLTQSANAATIFVTNDGGNAAALDGDGAGTTTALTLSPADGGGTINLATSGVFDGTTVRTLGMDANSMGVDNALWGGSQIWAFSFDQTVDFLEFSFIYSKNTLLKLESAAWKDTANASFTADTANSLGKWEFTSDTSTGIFTMTMNKGNGITGTIFDLSSAGVASVAANTQVSLVRFGGDTGSGMESFTIAPIPEPGSLALLGLGGLLIGARRRRNG